MKLYTVKIYWNKPGHQQIKIFVIKHTWAVPVHAKTKTADKVSQTLLSAPKLRFRSVLENIVSWIADFK